MSGPALPQTGERLGPYELTSPLGVGGMAEVHRARDTRLGRDVAIKVLDFEAARNPERLRLFEQEARAASAVNHPAIVGVHDVGREGDVPYVVLELVEGETLQRRLLRGRLPQRRAIETAVQIAQGLAAAHARGVLHNDLKPANIILTRDGRVKILDFGLAGLRSGSSAVDPLPADERATVTQALFGTPGYIAPERIEGAPPDARSDLFSLGAVLYEMLAGAPAFDGPTTAAVLAATTELDPAEIRPPLPAALDRILRRALEKDPAQRFQSASDLAYALDAVSTITAAPLPSAPPASRRWPRRAALALALAALLFGVGTWAGRYVWVYPLPSFQRLTFRYGSIASARLGPDGHTLVYSATWDGAPQLSLYAGRVDSRGATEMTVRGQVASIDATGELAFFPDRPHPSLHQAALSPGQTLAQVPMNGGAPREVLQDVVAADWSPEVFPDGRRLAVIRDLGGSRRLEFPIGHVLYQTAYGLRAPRFSRHGDLIAFVEALASGDCISVVDLQGRRRLLTQGEDFISSTSNLGWSPDGSEVWFTAEKRSEQVRYGSWRPALRAVSLSGRERELLRLPQFQMLQDVAADGRLLMTIGGLRSAIYGKPPDESTERDLSWHEGSSYTELTRDGRTLLFFEQAEAATYLRPMNGGPAQRLCSGQALGLSPDGRFVVPMERLKGRLTLIPTDAHEPISVAAPAIVPWGFYWFADGHRLLVAGNEEGKRVRAWVIDIRDGSRRAVTPEGIGCWLVSPDSKTAACARPEAEGYLYPIEGGGQPRPIPGFRSGDHMRQWSADGRYLYVSELYAVPARVYRIDLQTGERVLWRELTAASSAGVVGTVDAAITPDGTAWAYAVLRNINDLYLVEGIR